MASYYPFFWAFLLVIFILLEAATISLVSIWFCVGALAALISSLFVTNLGVQCGIFVVVSVLCLLAIRPLYKKVMAPSITQTNADKIVGKTAIVTENVNNIKGTGQATVGGVVWKAKSQTDDEIICSGMLARVVGIEGVSLILTPSV